MQNSTRKAVTAAWYAWRLGGNGVALSLVLSDDVQIDAVGAAAPSLSGPVMGCQFNLQGIDPADILPTDQATDRVISVWIVGKSSVSSVATFFAKPNLQADCCTSEIPAAIHKPVRMKLMRGGKCNS